MQIWDYSDSHLCPSLMQNVCFTDPFIYCVTKVMTPSPTKDVRSFINVCVQGMWGWGDGRKPSLRGCYKLFEMINKSIETVMSQRLKLTL